MIRILSDVLLSIFVCKHFTYQKFLTTSTVLFLTMIPFGFYADRACGIPFALSNSCFADAADRLPQEKDIELRPDWDPTELQAAFHFLQTGDYSKARDKFILLKKNTPVSYRHQIELFAAYALFLDGKTDEALGELEQIRRRYSDIFGPEPVCMLRRLEKYDTLSQEQQNNLINIEKTRLLSDFSLPPVKSNDWFSLQTNQLMSQLMKATPNLVPWQEYAAQGLNMVRKSELPAIFPVIKKLLKSGYKPDDLRRIILDVSNSTLRFMPMDSKIQSTRLAEIAQLLQFWDQIPEAAPQSLQTEFVYTKVKLRFLSIMQSSHNSRADIRQDIDEICLDTEKLLDNPDTPEYIRLGGLVYLIRTLRFTAQPDLVSARLDELIESFSDAALTPHIIWETSIIFANTGSTHKCQQLWDKLSERYPETIEAANVDKLRHFYSFESNYPQTTSSNSFPGAFIIINGLLVVILVVVVVIHRRNNSRHSQSSSP